MIEILEKRRRNEISDLFLCLEMEFDSSFSLFHITIHVNNSNKQMLFVSIKFFKLQIIGGNFVLQTSNL